MPEKEKKKERPEIMLAVRLQERRKSQKKGQFFDAEKRSRAFSQPEGEENRIEGGSPRSFSEIKGGNQGRDIIAATLKGRSQERRESEGDGFHGVSFFLSKRHRKKLTISHGCQKVEGKRGTAADIRPRRRECHLLSTEKKRISSLHQRDGKGVLETSHKRSMRVIPHHTREDRKRHLLVFHM